MKKTRHDPVTNPRRLAYQSWVYSWHVSYHKTAGAAARKASAEARQAARQNGGTTPIHEVRRVVFPAPLSKA